MENLPRSPDKAPVAGPTGGGETERTAARAVLHGMVEEHAAALYRAAYHPSGRVDDAEDLVQETFLRAWRSFRTFNPGGNARAWLYKILMMRVHLDARRRQRAAPPVDHGDAEAVDELYLYRRVAQADDLRDAVNPKTVFFENLVGGEVQAALHALPAAYRQVLLLTTEGFAYREIADLLDIPLGMVMSRLHRARAFLQKRLWDYCVQTGRCRPSPPVRAGTSPGTRAGRPGGGWPGIDTYGSSYIMMVSWSGRLLAPRDRIRRPTGLRVDVRRDSTCASSAFL